MKNLLKYFLGTLLLTSFIFSCSKDSSPAVVDMEPDEDPAIVLEREQNDAEKTAIALSVLNEVLTIPLDMATRYPFLLGFTSEHEEEAQVRSCPSTQLILGANGIDTLVLDYGSGCTTASGATVSGQIYLISSGSLNSNNNQFIQFDTITINGYQIIHNYGVGSSGLKFNNITPNMDPPNYLFEGKAPFTTSFVVSAPNGDVTSIVPQFSPNNFMQLTIVDNDPPLTLDYLDFEDAHYEGLLAPLHVSTFRANGHVDVYLVSQIVGQDDPLIFKPSCRWLTGGQLRFQGTITQLLNYGWDFEINNTPVMGPACDGIVKVSDLSGNNCQFIQCP